MHGETHRYRFDNQNKEAPTPARRCHGQPPLGAACQPNVVLYNIGDVGEEVMLRVTSRPSPSSSLRDYPPLQELVARLRALSDGGLPHRSWSVGSPAPWRPSKGPLTDV